MISKRYKQVRRVVESEFSDILEAAELISLNFQKKEGRQNNPEPGGSGLWSDKLMLDGGETLRTVSAPRAIRSPHGPFAGPAPP